MVLPNRTRDASVAPRGPKSRVTPTARLRSLLILAQQILDETPLGLLVLAANGSVLWRNREAEIVCAIWNDVPLSGDALPRDYQNFQVPPALLEFCRNVAKTAAMGTVPESATTSVPERGLHATVRYQPGATPPAFFLQLDYRRPRGDRDHPMPAASLGVLNRLSFREREVALRVRDGLSNREIARVLSRSPYTIKTQLGDIFRKLGINRRSRLVALLHR